jgi:glycolate oxidase iron-sulfur subunit
MKRAGPPAASRYPLLEKYREDVSRCVKCGSCGAVCPSFQWQHNESFSARGRMTLVKAVLEGRLRISAIFKDRLETCTTCLACETSCPSGVRVTEIIQAAKEEAVNECGTGIINALISTVVKHPVLSRAGQLLAPAALHYTKDLVKGHRERPTFQAQPQRSKEAVGSGAIKKKNVWGRVAYFPGCAATYFQQDINRSVVSVLKKLGFEVIVPKEQRCCGRPLLSLGDRKSAEDVAARNAALFSGFRPDAIITACASCGLTFKREYPKLLPPDVTSPLVLDIHEFLSTVLIGIELKPVKRSVTCHDPCHLNRGLGLSGTLRSILRSIPGLSLVEMNNPGQCCGFGGVMRVTHRELSDGIVENKVRDIMRTDASTVVTGCPGCRMQIADALRRVESDVNVVHTIQILDEAL